ncbi:type II secretion system protein [Clostridium thermobutyricum]|uniref:Type II secretion system protein G n=1 Tax=Clostridium thermobutyricum DSM 4928 TaxID=1121339 RepID=A0A1V4T0S3_9CLOT|nr:type II secretion system protein [Clostridium thermobutyricum]OPX50861.1 type II secretion system protein G precursor [Clostridium thermobutyricum DSM 4928]
MRNLIKNKKKKGFTLIEMVAVVAIIGILAAILVPKITGYMKEAKKTGVVDQARKVSQAYETAKMKNKLFEKDGTTATDESTLVSAISNPTMLSLIDGADLSKILGVSSDGKDSKTISIGDCINITNGAEFNVTSEGKLIVGTITTK